MPQSVANAVLVATLGAEPQIIPIALQLLLRQQISLTHVDVLYTAPDREPIQSALREVRITFGAHPNQPEPITIPEAVADLPVSTPSWKLSLVCKRMWG